MIRALDHVAVAVRRMEERLAFWETLGLRCAETRQVASEGVKVGFLPVAGVRLELLEPTGADSPVAKFLGRRGEGIHHLCLRVDSVAAAVRDLERRGVRIVGGIRDGADGAPITFLHPRDAGGVLIELTEAPAPASGSPQGTRRLAKP
ncbi:MAG: methylmalonyl-CoA epimerase [Acidobacteria bacterium]|nr:methylmalonyl-CoA epimerase [Acidobacteriota bacterium]